jgi:hypothetical protein
MRWLYDNPGAWRSECTDFGINMLTGNYEFPCLIVIDHDRWWAEYGDQVEANWEAVQLRCFSSTDTNGLDELIRDP